MIYYPPIDSFKDVNDYAAQRELKSASIGNAVTNKLRQKDDKTTQGKRGHCIQDSQEGVRGIHLFHLTAFVQDSNASRKCI